VEKRFFSLFLPLYHSFKQKSSVFSSLPPVESVEAGEKRPYHHGREKNEKAWSAFPKR
jgi:hypothetical protein